MYCTNCGHANPESSRFCEQCGTPLEGAQQKPPVGGRPVPPVAKTSIPIWVLVSVIGGAAVILGFISPWFGFLGWKGGVKLSGFSFIFYLFDKILNSRMEDFMEIVSFLIYIGIVVITAVMAVKIIQVGVKLLGNHATLPGELNQAAKKIKRYSITGLFAIGIHFMLMLVLFTAIINAYSPILSDLGPGLWLCLIGFVAALLGATVVKQRF